MKCENLVAIVLVGLLGVTIGTRLDDHFNSRLDTVGSLVFTIVSSSLLATTAWALIARPGSIVIALIALVIASAAFLCLLVFQLSTILSPIAILATGWALGNIFRQWIPIPALPILGLVLGLIVIIVLWAGADKGYWQPDSLLRIGFLSCAWIQALALEGFRKLIQG